MLIYIYTCILIHFNQNIFANFVSHVLLYNKVPQTQMQITHTCDLTVSVGQESVHGLAESSASGGSHEALIKALSRTGVMSKSLPGDEPHLKSFT